MRKDISLLGLFLACTVPAVAAQFVIIDCNPNGKPSSQPFGQQSTCNLPHSNDFVSTASYVSYTNMASALSLSNPDPRYAGEFSTLLAVYDNWTIGGIPYGQIVQLSLVVQWAGGYNINISPLYPNNEAEVATYQLIELDNVRVIDALEPIIAVSPGKSGTALYTVYNFNIASFSGDVLPFYWAFENDQSTSFAPISTNDFFFGTQPGETKLSYQPDQKPSTSIQLIILAKDPNTGLPIPGITITGADGFHYPVNAPCSKCSE